MGLLKAEQLRRLTNVPISHQLQSASVNSIRAASSPEEALRLYKIRLQRLNPGADFFDTHAAVFTVKACSKLSGAAPLIIPQLHAHLLKTNLFFDVHVPTALLHAYTVSSFHDARLLFDEIHKKNVVTANTMITCYSNHGDLSAARSLFDGTPERDIVSWSAMIGGYMNRGCRAQGLALFREMINEGKFKPDLYTLVAVLSGCSSITSLRLLGRSIHAYSERSGLEINTQLGTSLIDMYAKSGCMKSAFRMFERMTKRNVMHWTAMICGLASHGQGEEAVALFEEMKKAGVKPNEFTFTGVLNACCHTGLVEEGERYFCIMVEEFGYEPGIHHYGCMVDLLAKAGRLLDTRTVIENMKVEPNIVVWSSFLAGCRMHKSFEIAEEAIERVLSIAIPEEDGGVYTLISDLYALGGKWNDVERVRKLMDTSNVRKNRGSSFVNIN